MLKNITSRYSLSYPKNIVYMLQATEYIIRDYLAWYLRTRDFNKVANVNHLVKTLKSRILLSIAWLTILSVPLAALWAFSLTTNFLIKGSIIAFVLLLPFYLPFVILIPLVAIKLAAQLPAEYFIIKKAKAKLAAHKAVKIAIAGSYGKTTMREILRSVLSEGRIVKAPKKSINTPLGISRFINGLNGDEEILIFELGEYFPGDILKLSKLVNPDIGIITGINEAHLSKFRSIEQTVRTIFELADYMGDKQIYINKENELARLNARGNYQFYSQKGVGDWKVEEAASDLSGTYLKIRNKKDLMEVKTSLLGLHNTGPLALSAKLANSFGLNIAQIKQGISKTKPFKHRLEHIKFKDGVDLLDDSYNGNPDGVKAVINFFSNINGHRRFYVTPGLVEMGENKENIHTEIGKWLAEANIEKIVLIKNSVTPFVERGMRQNNFSGELYWYESMKEALSALAHLTVEGDVILIQNDWTDQYH